MKLINISEAAGMLGVAVATVRRWVLRRQIPFIKLGAAVRFDTNELEKWLKERRVPAGNSGRNP